MSDSLPHNQAHGKNFHFAIKHVWDGEPIQHSPVEMTVSAHNEISVRIDVEGPLFNDPSPPPGSPGKPCGELWEYEVDVISRRPGRTVVHAQFNTVSYTPRHGQHLVLLLHGTRKMFKDKLDIDFSAQKDEESKRWSGTAVIPIQYFPPGVSRVNAYAIHGSESDRQYEALYPASKHFHNPDFHRLQFFNEFDFKAMFDSNWIQPESMWWKHRI